MLHREQITNGMLARPWNSFYFGSVQTPKRGEDGPTFDLQGLFGMMDYHIPKASLVLPLYGTYSDERSAEYVTEFEVVSKLMTTGRKFTRRLAEQSDSNPDADYYLFRIGSEQRSVIGLDSQNSLFTDLEDRMGDLAEKYAARLGNLLDKSNFSKPVCKQIDRVSNVMDSPNLDVSVNGVWVTKFFD